VCAVARARPGREKKKEKYRRKMENTQKTFDIIMVFISDDCAYSSIISRRTRRRRKKMGKYLTAS
jgi:hypothetical protein